jgi:phage gp36-like protein
MSYATLADLYARFGADEIDQVADTDGTGSPDMVLVGRAIADAGAEIDAALVGRYQLPMLPVPPLLQRIACDLVRESLYTDSPPDNVRERAKTARALLRSVATGQSRFEGAALAMTPTADQGLVEIVTGRRKG